MTGAAGVSQVPAGDRQEAPQPTDIWNALPTPSLLLSREGHVLLANAAAEIFLNASQATLADKGFAAVWPTDSAVKSLIEEARANGQGVQAYDVPIEFLGGRQVRADVFVGQVPGPGRWLTLSFQSRAVTSLVERQMGPSSAARTAVGVAAMLAHEIRNPLSGIRGAAQLLHERVDEDSRELADLVISEVDRIGALIDTMEGFTDERPRRLEPENIHAILSHVRRVAEAGFGQGMRFAEHYDPSLPPVLGDRQLLTQALLNLVKNAVEASPPGGTITLTTAYRAGIRMRPAGSQSRISLPLEVAVIDEGEGVPADLVDHLFEPFVTSKRAGSGLGLALVAKVVSDHGGLVQHERRQGRTAFRMWLPAATAIEAA
jgi:two-component system nitrogen regulation sensor histidine kinase GlnL